MAAGAGAGPGAQLLVAPRAGGGTGFLLASLYFMALNWAAAS